MRWLRGHTKDVRAVAFTKDGRLVSGGSDRSVRVWDPVSGKALRTLKAPNVVYAVAVSPDGKTLAFASRYADSMAESKSVHLWDLEGDRPGGEYEWDMQDLPRSIWSLSFSADGLYLAAACRSMGGANIPDGGGAHWWRRKKPFAEGDFEFDRAYALGFAPAGADLAMTVQHAVALYDRPGGGERFRYPLPSAWAAAVAFVPSGEMLVIAANSFLLFADATAPGNVQRVRTGLRTLAALAVSPDGRMLLAGGRPETVECYDIETQARRTTYDFGIGGVHALAFAPDGCTFAVGGDKGLLVCDVG